MVTALGYAPDFLASAVALPVPLTRSPLRDLDYPRFTIRLNPRRRFAGVTGVNIDGAALQDLERTGDWDLDPRVPPYEQAGPDVYADNDLDRGHLVRRRDPGWGTVEQARAATEATFVYPNAAPQASDFNQSKELWLGLEDHVLRFADAADLRVSVFTAPVLADDDPPYRGIRIPRRFWKVAAWSSAGAENNTVLAAAGFVLDQTALIDTTAGVASVTPLGAFRTFQAPIAEIGRVAAIGLGPLVTADVLPGAGVRDPDAWLPLRRASDVVLR